MQNKEFATAAKQQLANNKDLSNIEIGETTSPQFLSEETAENSMQQFVVDSSLDGHRLDFALSREFGISRGFSAKLIKEGQVSLFPERRVKPSLKIACGDKISVYMPPVETLDLEPEDVPFEVVYSDEDVIVINKPAGLVVHPSPGHWTGTLVHGLLYRFPDMGSMNGVQRPGIVHRLDSTTSGLMVVARNGLAQESLFRQFKDRRVEKVYLALCHGTLPSPSGEIRYPIGRDPFNRLRQTVLADGREAWTDYEVLWNKNGYSLVQCELHTGRTHQIRVHLKALKCPLVGDRLYDPSRQSPFPPERLFLHAWKLSFTHPRTNEKLKFRAALAAELTEFLRKIK